jgi:hypothetical protein
MRRLRTYVVGPVLVILTGIAIAVGSEQGDPKTGVEKWAYPEAKRLSGQSGGGLEQALYVTGDDLEKVLKFYGKKLGQKLSGNNSAPAGGIVGGPDQQTGSFDDSAQPYDAKAKEYPRRAVAMHIATQNTKEYTVNIVITRVPAESHTHIALTFVKR